MSKYITAFIGCVTDIHDLKYFRTVADAQAA